MTQKTGQDYQAKSWKSLLIFAEIAEKRKNTLALSGKAIIYSVTVKKQGAFIPQLSQEYKMKTHEMDWIIDPNATLTEIKRILGIAEALIGNGRFVLTVESDRQKRDNYLFHHFYPTAYSYEDTKLVGEGGLQSCFKSLGEYVAKHQTQEKPYTTEQVAATLGIVLPQFDRRATIRGRESLEKATAKFIAEAGPDMEPYFREGWHACVSKIRTNPYPFYTHDDERHAWDQGWCAADRYLSAPINRTGP